MLAVQISDGIKPRPADRPFSLPWSSLVVGRRVPLLMLRQITSLIVVVRRQEFHLPRCPKMPVYC